MKALAFGSLPGFTLSLIASHHNCVTMAKPSRRLHLLSPFSGLSTYIRVRQDAGHGCSIWMAVLRLASLVRCSGANSPCSQEHCLLAQKYCSVRFYCLCSSNASWQGIAWVFMDTYTLPWECKLASLLQQICRPHITMDPHSSSNSTHNSKLIGFMEMWKDCSWNLYSKEKGEKKTETAQCKVYT